MTWHKIPYFFPWHFQPVPRSGQFSRLLFLFGIFLFGSCAQNSHSEKYYGIKIIDQQTHRGIPMVEISMLNSIVYHTDNQGYIAFNEPDLMHEDLYFELKSAGYHYPMDETGRQGVSLRVTPGKDTILEMQRINIAERLYRITGSGKNIHVQALGLQPGNAEKLKAGVLGQDSNLAKPYKGKIFWVWGDTFLPPRYRGNFSVASAWTSDPRTSGWSAEDGIDLNYISDARGWSKSMINLPGPGYVWFDFLMTLPDGEGAEILIAKYSRVNAYFGNYERGIAVYNDEEEIFEKYREEPSWLSQFATMEHPSLTTIDGKEYYYLNSEFNFSRIIPTLEAVSDASQYEHFTCLLPGEKLDWQNPKVERKADGAINYAWKNNSEAIKFEDQKKMVDAGILTQDEGLIQTVDVLTGEGIDPGRGSIYWNQYRQRWILIAGKQDVWYGEGDTPTGPWVYLRKIATHDQFFYNPVHHDFLDEREGRRIFFEGTFTKFFSQEPAIPRYDYNQLLYGLDLDDPELFLPVPIYQLNDRGNYNFGLREALVADPAQLQKIAFFALDRKVSNQNVVSIFQSIEDNFSLTTTPSDQNEPIFYAIRADFSPETFFDGSWEFKISSKSFDNTTVLKLENEGEAWAITSRKPSFQFSGLNITGNSFIADLEHEAEHYHLRGNLVPGGIDGSFFKEDQTTPAGTWSAEKTSADWWLPFSPHLVDLYEIRKEDGSALYSTTKPSAFDQGIESVETICKVWSNPFSIKNFDFTAVSAGE